MALYDKLLLSKGGGIIPKQYLVEQLPNTATLLIGLGGTGIDCISLIKEKVHTRIMPDDLSAATLAYNHIRFLGVDIDNEHTGLDNSEYFSVACNTSIKARFSNHHINKIPYLSWLNRAAIAPHLTGIANNGHGNRQIGRFLMMDKSADFIERLDHEINQALEYLEHVSYGQPTLNIHIISSMTGSMGSGSFLDVCYMVKYVAKRLRADVTIYGDFFLPDVSLTRIPSNYSSVRDSMCINGYAAMQELDYCMRLAKNGGAFTQDYQGHHQIKWDSAPVDICNLVGSRDSANQQVHDRYHNSLDVTSEYVMMLLTQETSSWMANLAQIKSAIYQARTVGAETCYWSLGASRMYVPTKEILTYLTSQLFFCFKAKLKNTMQEGDIDILSKSLFETNNSDIITIYDTLLKRLKVNVPGDFESYGDDWRFVRDYGNSELVRHYTDQAAVHFGILEKNAEQLLALLKSRTNWTFAQISSDVNAGPLYLNLLLSPTGKNTLIGLIDALIETNNSRWNGELAQYQLRVSDYDSAKANFDNRNRRSIFDTDEKRFNDYEHALHCLSSHKRASRLYELMDHTLKKYRQEIYNLSESVFFELGEITESLIATFDSNKNLLNICKDNNSGASPLITLEEIKPVLDSSCQQLEISKIFHDFISYILENLQNAKDNTSLFKASALINIPELVSDYFSDVLEPITSQYTVDSVLRIKYPEYDSTKLADAIYRDIYKDLGSKAAVLYPCSPIGNFGAHAYEIAFLCYPKSSVCNRIAANQMRMVDSRFMLSEEYSSCKTTSEDHISCVRIQLGLPLCAYSFIQQYEHIYFNTASKPGCHLYDGLPEKSIPFTDWKKLPSIIPFSLTDKSFINRNLAEMLNASADLFMSAYATGIIDIKGQVFDVSESNLSKLQSLCNEAGTLLFKAKRAQDMCLLENIAASIRNCNSTMLTASDISINVGDCYHDEETAIRILMDYFISSPAIHDHIRSQLHLSDQAKDVKERATSVLESLDTAISQLKSSAISFTRTVWCDSTGYDDWDESEEDDFIYDIPIADMSEKYIFISYAHKDSDIVLPILRRMSQDGYVIWYDNHIAAASEWDDSIAEHIENSSYVISFISKNYMESENCMDELKYARDEKKKPLLVFLEDLALRGGLAMRLNRLQHIHHFKFANDEMFFRKLYEAEGINVCRKK